MGDLKTALAETRRLTPGPPCSVAVAVDAVTDPSDRAALLSALSSGMTAPQIQDALEAVGVPVPPHGQIGSHRRGKCKCEGREWDGLTGRRDG